MQHSAELRRCLEQVDVAGARKLWAHVAPHLPQPKDDGEALAVIHITRTQSPFVAFKLRAYSHAWLLDHNLPSQLPDQLKPSAERIYPRIVEGVGIAVKTSERRRELGDAIRKAMRDVVMNCYADGETDPALVKTRMLEARTRVLKGD